MPRKKPSMVQRIHQLSPEARRREAALILAAGVLRLIAQADKPSPEEEEAA